MSALETGKANALREAVLASPQDDTPRLVYADYLSELGNPRGELITVQCLQKQLEDEKRITTPEYRAAYWRGQQLEKRFVDVFRREDRRGIDVVFKRGFVDWASAETMQILRAHVDQLEREPLRQLSMGASTLNDLREIAAMPIARTLEDISIRQNGYVTLDAQLAFEIVRGSADEAAAWRGNTGVPHPLLVPAVKVLSLSFQAATNEQLDELAHAAPPRLRELYFTGSARTSQAFARLTRTPTFAQIETASFHHLSEDDMVQVLEHGRGLKALSMYLGPRPDTAKVAAALAKAPALSRLTSLNLACDANTMIALGDGASSLESLIANDKTPELAIAHLAVSPLPKRLEHLSIAADESRPNARQLTEAPFERLLYLGLRDVALPSTFATAPALETLTRLHLHGCEMPEETATAIRKRWSWARLE